LRENVGAVGFINRFKTAAKVLYRKRFDKKILKIYFSIFKFGSEWSLYVSDPFSRHQLYPDPEASGRDTTAVRAKELVFSFLASFQKRKQILKIKNQKPFL
jgi:hypothetical protein